MLACFGKVVRARELSHNLLSDSQAALSPMQPCTADNSHLCGWWAASTVPLLCAAAMGCYVRIFLQEFTSHNISSAAKSTTAQQCLGEKERHKEKEALTKVTYTQIRQKQCRSPGSSPWVSGVLNQDTFHSGTHILVLPFLAQASLPVTNSLSSILQNQPLNFYLDLGNAVRNTSDENYKLC